MNKYKAFTQPVTQVVDTNTGEVLPQSEENRVLELLATDVRDITALVEWTIREDPRLLQDIDNYTGNKVANSKLGQYLNVKLPSSLKKRATGNSRYEHLYQDQVISIAKSWGERVKAFLRKSSKYVSAGWERTANPNKPSNLSPKIDLSAGAVQYAQIINDPFVDNKIELKVVINQKWYILVFNFDADRFKRATRITLPTVKIDDNGRPVFSFTAEYAYDYVKFSEDYIIGVDVGINTYATVSVVDIKTKRIVETTQLSRRVKSLENSINATEAQVKYLTIKQENLFRAGDNNKARALLLEISDQRAALSRKRKELAILAGQEIAELSYSYGNALVILEDLSHIKNTMLYGRWNRGELKRWVTHYVELNGGRVFSVNPAYTSQECYKCKRQGRFRDYSTFVCEHCELVVNRDVNASANVALRGLELIHPKACTTRKNVKRLRNHGEQKTPRTRDSLKYPGRDRTKNKPTPKRRNKGGRKMLGKCSVKNNDSVQTVITDGQGRGPVRTLKKQHDQIPLYHKKQDILRI